MHVEELEGEADRGAEREDVPAGLETFLEEVKGPGGKADGGDLLCVPGIDEGGVLRGYGEDEPADEGAEASDPDGAAEAVGPDAAEKEVEHHEPPDVRRLGKQPEQEVAVEEELHRNSAAPLGAAAVGEEVP